MKIKNLICMLLVMIMVFASVGVSAAEDEAIEIFTNGGCEMIDLRAWDTGSNPGCGISDEIVRTGKYSYKVTYDSAEGTGPIGVADFKDAMPGATYTFTGWVYIDKKLTSESHPGIVFIFYDADTQYLHREDVDITDVQEGKWYEIKAEGVAPQGTARLYIQSRMYKGGTFYWDDCSVKVSGDKKIMAAYKEQVEMQEKLLAEANAYLEAETQAQLATEMVEGTNLLHNTSFEEGEGAAAKSWTGYQNQWGPVTSRTDEEARTGNYSMKIDTRNTSNAPYGPFANQQIFIEDGLIPGQKYVFSTWVKVKGFTRGGGAELKIEPYSAGETANETVLPTADTSVYTWEDEDPNGDEWHQLRTSIVVDDATKKITLLIRLRQPGVVYYDDVTFGIANEGARFDMYSTRAFNYKEKGYGTAIAEMNTTGFALVPGSGIRFELKDGDTVLDSATLPAAATVTWNYDLSKMPEELKAYSLEATYVDENGNLSGKTQTKRVYKTSRPTKLNENGNYIDENGEYFFPVIGYGDGHDFWKESEVHGINVFKDMYSDRDYSQGKLEDNMKRTKKMLDDGLKEGVKFCIQFSAMEPNAYPGTFNKRMEAFLDECANHPAIFAYFLLDEVSLKINPAYKIKTYDYMEYWLEQSYIQIRAKDTTNPIYLLDIGSKDLIERSSRIGDIFGIDPYAHWEDKIPGLLYSRTRWGGAGNNYEVPVATIVQVTPFKDEWRPTATAIRHQFYQSFWGGAKMVGMFSLTGASDMVLESIKDIPERYKEICQFYQTGEQQIAFEHFTTPETTLIANWQEEDVWYRIWQDKNGQNYLLIMNMKAKEHTVAGKLISNNGKVSADGYRATLINGTDMPKTITSPDNTFSIKVPSIGVGLYKLTPDMPFDLAKLDDNIYADVAGYEWAEKEIETLKMKDVVNEIAGGFAPGENITRADFAGFLIRSLGLTADSSSTFDDIDPNHYYAKEIAMGKALGILTGVGNNLYNPNEAISRQDVMTICSRGLEIAKKLETTGSLVRLETFKDSELFADYAALHASKMVIEGIVKGNPDQTINPLGNTTRAEAAVMMYRIMYKGQIQTKY